MEIEQSNSNQEPNTDLILTQNSIYFLRNTSPWMKFVSLAGIMMCLILVGFAIIIIQAPVEATNPYLAKLGSGLKNFVAVIDIFIAIILIFPCIYLLRYSNRIKKFIKTNNSIAFEKALSMQRKFWKYIGILTIIYVSIFGITIIGMSAGFFAGLLIK